MKSIGLLAAVVMIAALATSETLGQTTQIYDFEGSTEGFASNGGVFPVTNDTTGATTGTGSLKVEVPAGAFFVGALTSTVPFALGDPPGVASVIFDLTIEEQFAGAFADIGITIFGASQPPPTFDPQLFGLSAQFADITSLGVAPGTYEITLDLDSATNPLTFNPNESFNDIFGGFGTAPNDLIPTGFQFFVSKSTDAPVTFFIDNVRVIVPEPATCSMLVLGLAALSARTRRR